MFEMTPDQAALVTAILLFFPLAFQYLQLIAAQPVIAPILHAFVKWIRAHFPLPWSADTWKRIFVWGLALLVIALTGLPVLPVFPAPVEFTAAFATLLFTWATNTLLSIVAFGTTLHLLYKHLWSKIFSGAMATKKIEDLASKNI